MRIFSKHLLVAFSILLGNMLLGAPQALGFQFSLEGEVQYDPAISTWGVREAIGVRTESGLHLWLASSYRFKKYYSFEGQDYYSNDLLTEVLAGWRIPVTDGLAIEPYGGVHFSNWQFEENGVRYIERWAREYEYGLRVQLTTNKKWQPFVHWSHKTGFFSEPDNFGDETNSFGLGVSLNLIKRTASAEQEGAVVEDVEYILGSDEGYFVQILYNFKPGDKELDIKLLSPLVNRYVEKEDDQYFLYLGPFASSIGANNQRNELGLFLSRKAKIVFGTVAGFPIESP